MQQTGNNCSKTAEIYKGLCCYLLPGNELLCKEQYAAYYESAYLLWKSNVIEGLVSENLLEQAKQLMSDDFRRQDEAVCLFRDRDALGIFMFSWLDLRFRSVQEHSYFKQYYPKAVLDKLLDAKHHYIMTMGNLMVDKAWRKNKIGPCISEVLVGFAVKRFLQSQATALIAFSRNNRKTHELGYRHGAQPLLKKHITYGLETDIFAVYRDTAQLSPIIEAAQATENLWASKIHAIRGSSVHVRESVELVK